MKLNRNNEIHAFESGFLRKSSTVNFMRWKHSLYLPRVSVTKSEQFCRDVGKSKTGTIFDMKLIQNSEIRVFKPGIPQKSSTVHILRSIHSFGPPKGISSSIEPLFYRCKKIEKIGTIFDMKLIRKCEKRVSKSGSQQKFSTVDIMYWIHNLGPPIESVAISEQFRRDVKKIEKIGIIFDMKLI